MGPLATGIGLECLNASLLELVVILRVQCEKLLAMRFPVFKARLDKRLHCNGCGVTRDTRIVFDHRQQFDGRCPGNVIFQGGVHSHGEGDERAAVVPHGDHPECGRKFRWT